MRARLAPLAACAAAAGIFVAAFPNRLIGTGTLVALHVRSEMARISLAMLASHPWFGIGIGRYYDASAPLLASSSLAAYYFRENAHNNYLQLAAELGLVGAVAIGWLLWTVAMRVRIGVSRNTESMLFWLAAGLAAFLLTALVGHPLLTPQVSLNFWLLLGVAAGSTATDGTSMRRVAGCFCLLLLVTFPVRVRNEIRGVDYEHVTYGFGARSEEQGGIPYQTLDRRGTFFVRGDVSFVRIPLRAPSTARSGRLTLVAIELDGREVDRVNVGDDWTLITLMTPRQPPEGQFHRVALVAASGDAAAPEVRVGRLQIGYHAPQ
jgi:hypothetical protein